MALWSTKRRFIYGGSVVLILALILSVVFWKIFYHAPTCTDGFKNGGETGIDCGGACKNLCTSDALTPVVLWSKIFNISGDVYTAVAYIENPNINSKNQSATYQFKIYDSENKLITVKEGETSIPKGKKFAVFETGIILPTKPKSADLTFLSYGPWVKDTIKDPEVSINHSTLLSTTTIPTIVGTISNNSLQNIPEIELDVFVLDSNQNVVAASRTFVDNLLKKSSQDFVFTWQRPFNLGVEACVNPVDVVVVLDKSGSMRSEKINPPEPFTTVTLTAQNFIKTLGSSDQAAVVTFGNSSNIENNLSRDKNLALASIAKLFLSTTTEEQTNITAGLQSGFDELTSTRSGSGSKKVLILLTDGLPTLPIKPGEANFAATSAENLATNIKSKNIQIYTIGLGKNLSDIFLKTISTDTSHYFNAPTKETLASIYTKIGSALCTKKPNVIRVIYRFL